MAVLVKLIDGLAYASMKTRGGLAAASIKTINGLDVTSAGGIALVAHVAAASPPGGGTVTTGAINTTGSTLIVVNVVDYTGSTAAALSDNQGNTWTGLTSTSEPTLQRVKQYYCASPATNASHTFTLTGANIFASIGVLAFSGTGASPFQSESGNHNNTGTTIQPGSITPSADGSVIVTMLGVNANKTPAIDSGFTITDTTTYVSGQCFQGSYAYYVQPTAAAINPTWSWSGNIAIATRMASFK